jgi:hypothetical protein
VKDSPSFVTVCYPGDGTPRQSASQVLTFHSASIKSGIYPNPKDSARECWYCQYIRCCSNIITMGGVNLTHDMVKDKSATYHSTTRSRLSSLTVMPLNAWISTCTNALDLLIRKYICVDIHKCTYKKYHCSILTRSKPGIVFIFYMWKEVFYL